MRNSFIQRIYPGKSLSCFCRSTFYSIHTQPVKLLYNLELVRRPRIESIFNSISRRQSSASYEALMATLDVSYKKQRRRKTFGEIYAKHGVFIKFFIGVFTIFGVIFYFKERSVSLSLALHDRLSALIGDIRIVNLLVEAAKLEDVSDFGSAETGLLKAMELAKGRDCQDRVKAFVNQHLGNIKYYNGEYKEAASLYRLALKVISDDKERNNIDYDIIEMSSKMAHLAFMDGNTELADQGFRFCIEASKIHLEAMAADESEYNELHRVFHVAKSLGEYGRFLIESGVMADDYARCLSTLEEGVQEFQTIFTYSPFTVAFLRHTDSAILKHYLQAANDVIFLYMYPLMRRKILQGGTQSSNSTPSDNKSEQMKINSDLETLMEFTNWAIQLFNQTLRGATHFYKKEFALYLLNKTLFNHLSDKSEEISTFVEQTKRNTISPLADSRLLYLKCGSSAGDQNHA